jgi:hypothetical protein
VLGLANPVSDNIAGTFVGQGLATAFRYVAYTRWVFPHAPEAASDAPTDAPAGTPDHNAPTVL